MENEKESCARRIKLSSELTFDDDLGLVLQLGLGARERVGHLRHVANDRRFEAVGLRFGLLEDLRGFGSGIARKCGSHIERSNDAQAKVAFIYLMSKT